MSPDICMEQAEGFAQTMGGFPKPIEEKKIEKNKKVGVGKGKEHCWSKFEGEMKKGGEEEQENRKMDKPKILKIEKTNFSINKNGRYLSGKKISLNGKQIPVYVLPPSSSEQKENKPAKEDAANVQTPLLNMEEFLKPLPIPPIKIQKKKGLVQLIL